MIIPKHPYPREPASWGEVVYVYLVSLGVVFADWPIHPPRFSPGRLDSPRLPTSRYSRRTSLSACLGCPLDDFIVDRNVGEAVSESYIPSLGISTVFLFRC